MITSSCTQGSPDGKSCGGKRKNEGAVDIEQVLWFSTGVFLVLKNKIQPGQF